MQCFCGEFVMNARKTSGLHSRPNQIMWLYALIVLLSGFSSFGSASTADDRVCVYISSYHKGYAWSDGVERGLKSQLPYHCNVVQFDMDTKRQKTLDEKIIAGKAAFNLIKNHQPDVVIISDDNAAKYLVLPFMNDGAIPIVFSGINWTVEEYGFPFPNMTGIVEVAPIEPMLVQASKLSNAGFNAVYLGADTLTEKKNFDRIAAGATRLGISLEAQFTGEFSEWKKRFVDSQSYDFIIMGSNSGIEGWDDNAAKQWTLNNTSIPTLTNHKWMMDYTVLGYTKIPEEHGEWAAQSAIAILDGVGADNIPLVTNRQWDLWLNSELAASGDITLAPGLERKAKKIKQYASE